METALDHTHTLTKTLEIAVSRDVRGLVNMLSSRTAILHAGDVNQREREKKQNENKGGKNGSPTGKGERETKLKSGFRSRFHSQT